MNILFVDDELMLLNGLKRSLRSLRKTNHLHFVDSGSAALAAFEEMHFDLVVTDMRMPEMDGLQLLTEIKKRYPSVIRFVLSGYSDQEMINKAVALIHQYFMKPCDPDEIKNAIDRIQSLGEVLGSPDLRSVISGINRLPSLPHIYTQINEALKEPSCDIEVVADLVLQDASMSAEVLHLVNSAFFGLAQKITNVYQALMFLGVEVIRSVVFVIGVKGETRHFSPHFSFKEFSNESVKVAALARKIGEFYALDRKDSEQLFSMGVLLDIGKLVQASYLRDDYESFHSRGKAEQSLELEQEIFSATHAEIGAYLLVVWGLPIIMAQVVAFHHAPQRLELEDRRFINCLYLACLLCEQGDRVFVLDPDLRSEYLDSEEMQPLLDYVRVNKEEFVDLL